jgi:hypothetical protein
MEVFPIDRRISYFEDLAGVQANRTKLVIKVLDGIRSSTSLRWTRNLGLRQSAHRKNEYD